MLSIGFLTLALGALAASSPVPSATASETITIPLNSVASSRLAKRWGFGYAEKLKERYERLVASARRDGSDGRSAIDLTLFNYQGQDLVYYGTIQVGNPPQDVTVTFDTGSTDLFVPVACNTTCSGAVYAKTVSSTYKSSMAPVSFQYGTGQANGTLATDTVTLGDFTQRRQAFNAASSLSASFAGKPSSGLMGLGMQGMTQLGQPSFVNRLVKYGLLKKNEFSFYHARNGAAGSQLVLGGYNEAHAASDITWLPVPSNLFWGLEVDALTANGAKVAGTSVNIMLDTGTTQVILPKSIVKELYSQFDHVRLDVPDSAMTGYDYYEFPCNATIPDVGIRFSGSSLNFPINPLDFIIGIGSQDDYCIGGVIGADFDFHGLTNVGLVGVEFLKNYLAIYSFDHFDGQPAIGLATAR